MSLDRAYRMRTAQEEARKRDTLKHPVSGEDTDVDLGENDRTLSQIFQDKKEQDRFLNRYLYNRDPDMARDVAESLANGTLLQPEQETFLEKARTEYNIDRVKVGQVREMFDQQELARVASVDPRIKEIMGQIGPEQAEKLLDDQFEELALSDKKGFDKIIRALRSVKTLSTSEAVKTNDQHVSMLLREYGVSEEKFIEATQSGNASEMQQDLTALVRERYGGFKKAIDFVTRHRLSDRAGEELLASFEEQQALLRECDKHHKVIGKFLQGTLTPDVRLAIQKYLVEGGSVQEKKPENTVKTIKDYRAVRDELDTMPSRWQKYKESEIKRMNIKDISEKSSALEGMKDRFANAEMQRRTGHRASGAILALINLLFGVRSAATKDDIRKSLT